MMRKTGSLSAVLAVLALTACSAGKAQTTAQSEQDLPEGATVVVGVQHCRIDSTSHDFSGGREVMKEHFICQDEMSDPRVSGTDDLQLVTALESDSGGIWVSESATLTTSQGTWRGTARGVADLVGVLPTAQGVTPYNYGTVHWVGEGAYEGLEYEMFISGSDDVAGAVGWITETS